MTYSRRVFHRTLSLATLALSVLTCAATLFAEGAKEERLPVPAGPTLAAAEKTVQEVYAADYRLKDGPSRALLATKLMDAASSEPGAVEKFVLMRNARAVAMTALQWPVAMDASITMAKGYQLDELSLFTELTAMKLSPDAAVQKSILETYLSVIQRAEMAKRSDDAVKFATAAEQSFARQKSAGAAKRLAEVRQQIIDRKQIAIDYAAALKMLKEKPADPAANLAVGRYACFVDFKWAAGLPKLEKGADAALKSLAATECSFPPKAAEQADLAGAWWDYAQGQTGIARAGGRARAHHWYSIALPQLNGLAKTSAEKRIAECAPDAAAQDTAVAVARAAEQPHKGRSLVLVCEAYKNRVARWNNEKNTALVAITYLKPEQRFNVVTFKEGRPLTFQPELVFATPENIKAAYAYLDAMETKQPTAGGMNRALMEAFAQEPDLVYVLSKFEFDEATQAAIALRTLNVRHLIKVNTIQFSELATGAEVAKQIAQENGGHFKAVADSYHQEDPRDRKEIAPPQGAALPQ